MPVVKVPVQHKFGIVSLSKAEQFLEQGTKKTRTPRATKTCATTEITQDFISKYNATPEWSREKLDGVVKRALLHAKFKAGLHHPRGDVQSPSHGTSTSDNMAIDVSSAWLELTLLCQCYGPFQEEVLVTLVTSLNHAQLSIAHIPSLLYIAGLCYQWLKSDVVEIKVLRSGELLLLKILYLVSLRIFHHNLSGVLQDCCTREEVRQLKFDLEGFENREKVYRNFPEALLHWKVALEVGLMVSESHNEPLHDLSALSAGDTQECSEDRDNPSQQEEKADPSNVSKTTATPITAHGDHRLSPMLWHALDVWQCTRQECLSLEEAMEDLLTCSNDCGPENWMEGMLAMNILCAGSETNMNVLNLVHSLANGSGKLHYVSEEAQVTDRDEVHVESPPLPADPKEQQSLPKIETTLELPDDTAAMKKKDTRFQLPISEKGSTLYSRKESERMSSQNRINTLNILGMQPEFKEPYPATIVEEEQDVGLNLGPQFQARLRMERASGSPDSIGTQSLIEDESIPDILPSESSTNSSVNLDSSTSLDGLSNSKSGGGMLAGSLDVKPEASVSNQPSNVNVQSGSNHPREKRVSLDEAASFLGTRMSPAAGTPIEDKLEALESPLGEAIDRIGLLDDRFQYVQPPHAHQVRHVGISRRNVVVSLRPRSVETRCTHYTHSSGALSGGAGVPGSHVPPSTVYRHSIYSIPMTIDIENEDSSVFGHAARFENWPSEVAMSYTLNMASIVVYGRTSGIQKSALEGVRRGGGEELYGLMQLSEFANEGSVSKCDFTAWSIRHGAVLGLSKISRVCRQQPMKDGMSSVAWSKLEQRSSVEKDDRVLEAYKLSQTCPDLDSPLLAVERQPFSSPIIAHMADNLAQLFLPPVTPAPDIKPSPKRSSIKPSVRTSIRSTQQSGVQKHSNVKPKVFTRVSPRSKAGVPADFTTRTTDALNKIAKEHWRRQMTQEKEEEEREREKEEVKKKQEYEELIRRKLADGQ